MQHRRIRNGIPFTCHFSESYVLMEYNVFCPGKWIFGTVETLFTHMKKSHVCIWKDRKIIHSSQMLFSRYHVRNICQICHWSVLPAQRMYPLGSRKRRNCLTISLAVNLGSVQWLTDNFVSSLLPAAPVPFTQIVCECDVDTCSCP